MKLEHDLHDLGAAYEIPQGDVRAVRARARQRDTARRRAVSATAAVALLAVTAGAAGLLDRDPDGTPVSSEGAGLGDTGIRWSVAEPGADEALALLTGGGEAVGGRLYALSTAPGTRDGGLPTPKLAWRSDDGVSWTPAGSASDDLYLTDLAGRDGRIYAVGTGPATGAVTTGGGTVPALLVGWSDDAGESFETAEVPLDVAAIAAVSRAVGVGQQQVATDGDAVVVAIGMYVDLDVEALLPDGDTAPDGWVITPAGVEVLGERRDGCEVHTDGERPRRVWGASCDGSDVTPQAAHEPGRSYTWEELGVGDDARRAVLGHPFVFAGDGSGGFDRVDVADMGAALQGFALDAGDGGFDLMVTAGGPQELPWSMVLRSADGRTWERSGQLPGGLHWASAVGRIGDRTVVVGQGRTRSVVAVSTGDGGWAEVDLAALLDEPLARDEQLAVGIGDVGPAGVAVVGTVFSDRGDDRPDHLLFTSRDGDTWAVDRIDELAGVAVGSVGRVIVGDDRIVVGASRHGERGPDGHLRQVTLVGTAA